MGECYHPTPDCRCCGIECNGECVFSYLDTPQGEVKMMCRNYPDVRGWECGHPDADLCPSPTVCHRWVVSSYIYHPPNWTKPGWREEDGYVPGHIEVDFKRK